MIALPIIRLPFALAVILLTAAWCFAQTEKPACPEISVTGPSGLTNPGDRATFVAHVKSNGVSVKYDWAVDQGTIFEGQGTPAISVASRKGDTNIKATVRIGGFPSDCENSASETAVLAPLPTSCPMDSWGILKPNDERGRLDSYFVVLANNPMDSGLIVLGVTASEKLDPTNARIKFVMNHVKFRKFDADQLIFALELSDTRSTTLWRGPRDMDLPCSNCVIVNGRDLK